MSWSDGEGLFSSSSSAATSRPGVQKPHWTAPASMNACWIGASSPASPVRPSVGLACQRLAESREVPQAPEAQPPPGWASSRCLA